MEDINLAKKRKQEDEDAGIENYRSISICMTLEMHLLKRVFHYLTIFMVRTK
jgi:hypothetical protein